jgi:hypothetical protein
MRFKLNKKYSLQIGKSSIYFSDWFFIFYHLDMYLFFRKILGHKSCKEHGFINQSWINGKCKLCGEK